MFIENLRECNQIWARLLQLNHFLSSFEFSVSLIFAGYPWSWWLWKNCLALLLFLSLFHVYLIHIQIVMFQMKTKANKTIRFLIHYRLRSTHIERLYYRQQQEARLDSIYNFIYYNHHKHCILPLYKYIYIFQRWLV